MSDRARWLAGLVAVIATYVFFLLWVQFGFLELLRAALPATGVERAMAAMGFAGLAAGFLTAAGLRRHRPAGSVPVGLLAAALVALAGPHVHAAAGLTLLSGLLGAVTGGVTVSLASGAPSLFGEDWPLGLGAGTGIAYLLCNVPALFEATPQRQAAFVALLALGAAALLTWEGRRDRLPVAAASAGTATPWSAPAGVAAAAVAFLLLVWIDSSAFAIVQQSPALKTASWGSPAAQWLLGWSHLLGALAAGRWIGRGRFGAVLVGAWGLFAVALPALAAGFPWAAPLYAVGISLYSVALVAAPSLGGSAGVAPRWRAAWVFGVGGWIGSALGVGMAQELDRIVPGFVLSAGLPLLLAVGLGSGGPRRLRRIVGPAAVPVLVGVGGLAWGRGRAPAAPREGVGRGRAVYIAEGCIHCHSQYVRPGTADALLWGPARPLDRSVAPVLIGNRRQGPDLANVGNRRQREWERLHLQDPRSLSPGSTMPSYRRLFATGDTRGEDLLDYLDSLGRGTGAERHARISAWRPAPGTLSAGDVERGRAIFGELCSACHGEEGRGDGPLAPRVERPAMNLRKGAPLFLPTWGETADRDLALARLVRFGAPGTPMPGHETLTDREVADLVALVGHWLDEGADRRPALPSGEAP